MSAGYLRVLFFYVVFALLFQSTAFAAPNSNAVLPIFFNQAALSAVPDSHAALFKFLNPAGDPIARRISLPDAFSGEPVELAPGETAYATVGWFMYIVRDCGAQTVREVIDFDTPQCQVPNPEETDADTMLTAINQLPEECLGPHLDACAEFEGPVLRYDFGTGVPAARNILGREITQTFSLDGNPLQVGYEHTRLFKYLLAAGDPDNAPSLVCSEDLYYSPIYAYFTFGYQIPSQTGQCILKGSGVLLPTLATGEHELLIDSALGGVPSGFPPITIIQH